MRILLVHNEYSIFTGEEAAVHRIYSILKQHGHDVITFTRSTAKIADMRFGKIRAFLNGIYSFSSKRAIRKLLSEQSFDVVHINNLFPFISPSILSECRKAGIPIFMTVHNYRLFCPTGLYMTNGQICQKCNNGEHWCVLRNCMGNLPKSMGYALRNFVARKAGLYSKNVTVYAALTEFQRQHLIARGLPPDRVVALSNSASIDVESAKVVKGDYIGFAGRISPEKGISTIVDVASRCDDILFKIAGNCSRMQQLRGHTSPNLLFCGHLNKSQLHEFYTNSRIIILPSICYEGFPNTMIEAMFYAKPVICSRIGGLPEIVDDGVTGLLFEPGDADELSQKIRCLWDNPGLCSKMGQAGRQKALREYSPGKYYQRLMAAYKKTIEIASGSHLNSENR